MKNYKLQNTQGILFDCITSKENTWYSFIQTQKGKPKHKAPATRFRQDETVNLESLRVSVLTGTWIPRGFYKFEITEPKHRIIHAPAYEDKIIHHMTYQVLRDIYEPLFIHDSFSCIRGKGNQAAVKRLQQHIRVCQRNHKQAWLVKLDISKFFPSIDREILKSIYAKHIHCSKALDLVHKIIDSSPGDKGLPLGCVTSQLSANVYMNKFDQFVKHTLKVKHYIRYADDMFMIVKSKQEARELLKISKEFIETELNLQFSEGKYYIKNCNQGVDGLGYRIFSTHILFKSRTKKKIIKVLNDDTLDTKAKARSISSFNSYLSLADSHNFKEKVGIYDLLKSREV